MNNRERRAAKRTLTIGLGHLMEADPNCGLPVHCYACGVGYSAHALARITDGEKVTHFPLCEPCFVSPATDELMARKYLEDPDLEITEGGETTPTKH